MIYLSFYLMAFFMGSSCNINSFQVFVVFNFNLFSISDEA